MKAAEQYWLSCGAVNYAAVQGGSNLVWSLVVDKIIQMKASKQYFAAVYVAVFIIQCKVFLTSETMDETLRCDQSNWTVWGALDIVYSFLFSSLPES